MPGTAACHAAASSSPDDSNWVVLIGLASRVTSSGPEGSSAWSASDGVVAVVVGPDASEVASDAGAAGAGVGPDSSGPASDARGVASASGSATA